MSKLKKVKRKSTVEEKSLNIIDNPEIIAKLKNKIATQPEKIKRMKNKWCKYENEQLSILSELNEKIDKKQVSQ